VRIIVVGAGAMGSLYGGLLYEHGQDVVLVDVWLDHINAINTKGLRIDGDTGTKIVSVPACLPQELEGKADLVMIFTKTFHTRQAIEGIRRCIDDHTIILTLQNGLGNVELLQEYFKPDRMIVGTTSFPSDLVGPGHIRSTQNGKTLIMQLDHQKSEQLCRIGSLLDQAGFNCSILEDVFPFIWEKVAFNTALNSMSVVTRLTVGQLGSCTESRSLVLQVTDEVLNVAEKKGIAINRDRVRMMLEDAFKNHKDHKPSMLQDIMNGKKTEIDAINGAVVKEANQLGLEVPLTEFLLKLVKSLAAK
jgi:2-dehydropantoate 2-reductase